MPIQYSNASKYMRHKCPYLSPTVALSMFNEWLGWRMRTMLWWKLFLLLLHFASSILFDDATDGAKTVPGGRAPAAVPPAARAVWVVELRGLEEEGGVRIRRPAAAVAPRRRPQASTSRRRRET